MTMERLKKCKWISKNTGENSLMLRKVFEIPSEIEKASLYCLGLGQAVYFLNGKRVSDNVYITHFTKYDQRVLYNVFDVTKLISVGKNAIGVHLGNWCYNDCNTGWNRSTATWRAKPKLMLFLVISLKNGEEYVVETNSSWKAHLGPVVFNNMLSGEIYDARLYQNGWNLADFSENGWENAEICAGPGGLLDYVDMPPCRVVRTLTPTCLGDGIYDCGEGISGRARVIAKGKAGDEIVIKYGEHIEENGAFSERINMYNHTELKHTDKFILSGNGEEEFAAEFVYHGFRYVKISTDAELLKLSFEVIHNDFETIGSFECSDEMLNQIHAASVRSTLTNFLDMPTDCPQREQNGWTGDALASCEQSLMNFEIKDAYKKWLKDFKDVQRPNGQLPAIIPTSTWGYNWGSGPAWDSALIMIPYQVYLNTGDMSLICEMWDNMKLYMEFLLSMEEDFILDFGLGDWRPPYNEDLKCPVKVTSTAFFYADSIIMSKCAELMNEEDIYSELAEKIKESYRRNFVNGESYKNSQTFYAIGIYYGLFNSDEIADMAKKLAELVIENDYHIDCGLLGTKCIFTALSENGYADVLYKMVTNPTCPSYAYWINKGLKNLCEAWHLVDRFGDLDSLNHHMFSEVDNWFYKHIAGIQITEDCLVIKPCFIKELKWVKAKHREIFVSWDEESITINTDRKAKVIINGKTFEAEKGEHKFFR